MNFLTFDSRPCSAESPVWKWIITLRKFKLYFIWFLKQYTICRRVGLPEIRFKAVCRWFQVDQLQECEEQREEQMKLHDWTLSQQGSGRVHGEIQLGEKSPDTYLRLSHSDARTPNVFLDIVWFGFFFVRFSLVWV